MTIPETEPASFGRNPPAIGGLAYVYRVADAKLPHRAVLQKLGCRDLGACGIWNQFEFCLFLLAIAPMDTWKFFMMDDVAYESCDRMCLVSIGRQCGIPNSKETMPPPAAGADITEDPFAIFESPLLKPGGLTFPTTTTGFPANDVSEGQGDASDGEDSFCGEMEEQERESDHMAVLSEDDLDDQPIPRDHPFLARMREPDEASESGRSIQSTRSHQKATDENILKDCLGDRPGYRELRVERGNSVNDKTRLLWPMNYDSDEYDDCFLQCEAS